MNGELNASSICVLIVEDDENLSSGLVEAMESEGYKAKSVADGAKGLDEIMTEAYDLVVLDVMLPSMEGFEVCRRAREAGNNTPILFLTVKGSSADRIEGMSAGGDDYLTKPFHLDELLLRVKSILKRWAWYKSSVRSSNKLRFGENEVSFTNFTARAWDSRIHELTEKEAMILKVLSEHADQVISREDLLEKVWGYEAFPSTRTVDNFILRLRKRFEPDPQSPVYFHTVRGVGYRFTPDAKSDGELNSDGHANASAQEN